ncbi:MAG TPA: hypothetical protein VN655_10010 [Pseudolabrys sp.]|nr:hypothetical protein [Pseudolabrys sp.]
MPVDLDSIVFPSLKDRVAIVTGAGQGIAASSPRPSHGPARAPSSPR